MEWINFEDKKPNPYERILVAKQYRDVPYGSEGYDSDKSFLTAPIIMLDFWTAKGWDRGGIAKYWMCIPELPNE